MIVTKIEVQKNNKNKVNIYIDNAYQFSLFAETLLKNHIDVNCTLSQQKIDDLILQDSCYKALQLATNYVSKGLKSRKQIRGHYVKRSDKSRFYECP